MHSPRLILGQSMACLLRRGATWANVSLAPDQTGSGLQNQTSQIIQTMLQVWLCGLHVTCLWDYAF
jgi:hypothetical protein